jgi:DNA-binding transcriptional ArsR family regulator
MNEAYKALSDPTRRRILQLLRRSDMTAGEIGEYFKISAPALSRHFSILKAANLITSEKQANFIAYQLNVSVLEDALLELMSYFDLGKTDDE